MDVGEKGGYLLAVIQDEDGRAGKAPRVLSNYVYKLQRRGS